MRHPPEHARFIGRGMTRRPTKTAPSTNTEPERPFLGDLQKAFGERRKAILQSEEWKDNAKAANALEREIRDLEHRQRARVSCLITQIVRESHPDPVPEADIELALSDCGVRRRGRERAKSALEEKGVIHAVQMTSKNVLEAGFAYALGRKGADK